MGYYAPFPAELQQVEYVKLYFHLEISDYFDLPVLGLLQLRRELLQALKHLSAQDECDCVAELKPLLQPDLPADPVLLRQIQQPAPPLVLSPDISQHGLIEPKQRIILPILFLGSGIDAIDPFIFLLQRLGIQGLYHGSGRFVLEGVEAEDGSGVRSMLWSAGQQPNSLSPPICRLSWWLERQHFPGKSVQIEIITPLRLLHQGKPLFKAEFANLFPFLLRRVTALLAGHADTELSFDPGYMISISRQIELNENHLFWKDWRALKSERGAQNLGGLMGHFSVENDALTELLWILQLGSLFNFGKGSTYGAGQYRLNYS